MAVQMSDEQTEQFLIELRQQGYVTNDISANCHHCGRTALFTVCCKRGCAQGNLCVDHKWIDEGHYCFLQDCQESKAHLEQKIKDGHLQQS